MNADTVKSYTKSGDKTPAGPQWVVKVTPLNLPYKQVDDLIMCITIGMPCPTMKVRGDAREGTR